MVNERGLEKPSVKPLRNVATNNNITDEEYEILNKGKNPQDLFGHYIKEYEETGEPPEAFCSECIEEAEYAPAELERIMNENA